MVSYSSQQAEPTGTFHEARHWMVAHVAAFGLQPSSGSPLFPHVFFQPTSFDPTEARWAKVRNRGR
jgi:hypothetical protein